LLPPDTCCQREEKGSKITEGGGAAGRGGMRVGREEEKGKK